MRYGLSMVAAVCGMVGSTALPVSAGEEKPVEMSAVPAAVRAAAEKAAAGVEFSKAMMEMEHGQKVYELQGMKDGKKVEVDVMEDGRVDEIETEIMMDAVPAEVSAVLKKRVPDFKPKFIEKSERPMKAEGSDAAGSDAAAAGSDAAAGGSESEVYYEFEGQEGEMACDVEVSADGKKVIIEENDDKDERAGQPSEGAK